LAKLPGHFGNSVTVRAAKSKISSKCVFNSYFALFGVFKIKIIFESNSGPNLSQTVGLEGQK
jgi:hypothetical protein